MASKGNALRGVASDAAPQLDWLWESVQPEGDMLLICGNHDDLDDGLFQMRNAACGLPALLPHGEVVALNAETLASGRAADASVAVDVQAAQACDENTRPCSDSGDAASTAQRIAPEDLAGLSKQERAALYARLQFGKKRPAPSKLEKQEKVWASDNPAQSAHVEEWRRQVEKYPVAKEEDIRTVRIGAVHGIPASHTQGLKKFSRQSYFRAIEGACGVDPPSAVDILLTHSNPQLPGQEAIVRGEDSIKLFESFVKSEASLHLHGHMHTREVVSVLGEGKVVVNSDCRLVVFVPE